MIAKLSTNIAKFIRDHNDQAASTEVLMFSLVIVLNALLVTITVLGVSALTGRLGSAAIFLASYVTLRFFSGGMHLPTSRWCNTISIGVFLVLLHLPAAYWNAGLILNVISLLLIVFYAPTKDIMHLNLLGPKYTIHFKLMSIFIVGINFWLQSPILSLAFIAQAVSLTPVAYRGVSLLERR
jgi:accessory gene regulator B